jgi:DNA polymerase-3 subunit delta'
MEIIGHQKQWQFLKKSSELKKISHAYLFSGQEKLGKKTIALKWVSLITGRPFKKQHPDFILIEPENRNIQISQIRDLIWRLSLKPSFAPFKIAIIDQAHLMGIAAQHALLKTLEEPKGEAVLILITEKPERLFSTIRSRCEIIKFYPVKKEEIKEFLKKQKVLEKEAEKITELSRGRPGEAIDFIENPQKLEKRKKVIEEFNQVLNSSLSERFQYAKDLSQKDDLKDVLEIWLDSLRSDLIKEAKLEKHSLSQLKLRLELLQKINYLILNTNINSRLALETFFLNL